MNAVKAAVISSRVQRLHLAHSNPARTSSIFFERLEMLFVGMKIWFRYNLVDLSSGGPAQLVTITALHVRSAVQCGHKVPVTDRLHAQIENFMYGHVQGRFYAHAFLSAQGHQRR